MTGKLCDWDTRASPPFMKCIVGYSEKKNISRCRDVLNSKSFSALSKVDVLTFGEHPSVGMARRLCASLELRVPHGVLRALPECGALARKNRTACN